MCQAIQPFEQVGWRAWVEAFLGERMADISSIAHPEQTPGQELTTAMSKRERQDHN